MITPEPEGSAAYWIAAGLRVRGVGARQDQVRCRGAERWAVAAIPNAQIRTLDGHGHFAYKTDPAMVAAIIRDVITT